MLLFFKRHNKKKSQTKNKIVIGKLQLMNESTGVSRLLVILIISLLKFIIIIISPNSSHFMHMIYSEF